MFEAGQTVSHRVFGQGLVRKVDDQSVTVKFDRHDFLKTIREDFLVRIEPTPLPMPTTSAITNAEAVPAVVIISAAGLLPDVTRNNHGGNPESEQANKFVQESKESTRLKIVDYFVARGQEGATADEVVEAFETNHNHVAPRITELKADGRLLPTNERRPTRAGSSAAVLVAQGIR